MSRALKVGDRVRVKGGLVVATVARLGDALGEIILDRPIGWAYAHNRDELVYVRPRKAKR